MERFQMSLHISCTPPRQMSSTQFSLPHGAGLVEAQGLCAPDWYGSKWNRPVEMLSSIKVNQLCFFQLSCNIKTVIAIDHILLPFTND